MRVILCALIFALISSCVVDAKWARGSVDTQSKWVFLSKFAFTADSHSGPNNGGGRLLYNISNGPSDLVLSYYMWRPPGNREVWKDVYAAAERGEDCYKLRQSSLGNLTVGNSGGEQDFTEGYPRYWFIAASSCSSKNLKFDYSLHFLQSDGSWAEEVSYDQKDLPALYLFYFLAYFFGVCAHAYGVWSLHRSDFLHPVVKLLSATIGTQFLSIFCLFVHWMAYRKNGVGSPFMLGCGEFFDFLVQLMFMLLLLLIAKGWAISSENVSDKKILAGIIGAFSVVYLALFIFGWTGINPATTVYIYETGPGITILVLRALLLIYFIWCLKDGVLSENHPSKRRFYQIFCAVYTAWFISLHLAVIIAASNNNDPEHKIRTVEPFYVTINTLSLAILAFLFWPTQIVKYFDVRSNDGLLAGTAGSPYETL
eukprot:TRINITY_DN11265_c1_g1_i1.p1 TRINITY_DN11265_c1_g1~~TRINITY_DN11265_c1_g1_i1.p1  ORF type:complete len:426 (-),score=142.16 TRINITY_DN11265_c1_g1_i1:258-1535(-)